MFCWSPGMHEAIARPVPSRAKAGLGRFAGGRYSLPPSISYFTNTCAARRRMNSKLRLEATVVLICMVFAGTAVAQQQALAPQAVPQQQPPVQAAAPPQAPAQAPAGFALNALQQAELDQVLIAWQQQSAKINTFKCDFERWEYNLVFGPSRDIPLVAPALAPCDVGRR